MALEVRATKIYTIYSVTADELTAIIEALRAKASDADEAEATALEELADTLEMGV